jgi:DsbC/DsbD-like thiol-disulfide interchange protein
VSLKPITRLILAGALLLVGISGCDFVNNAQGPASVRVIGNSLEVASCSSSTVATIDVVFRAHGENEWRVYWQASGAPGVPSGQSITSKTLETQFLRATAADESSIGLKDQVSVSVETDSGRSFVASFEIDQGVMSGMWIHPDGSHSSSPCTDE